MCLHQGLKNKLSLGFIALLRKSQSVIDGLAPSLSRRTQPWLRLEAALKVLARAC